MSEFDTVEPPAPKLLQRLKSVIVSPYTTKHLFEPLSEELGGRTVTPRDIAEAYVSARQAFLAAATKSGLQASRVDPEGPRRAALWIINNCQDAIIDVLAPDREVVVRVKSVLMLDAYDRAHGKDQPWLGGPPPPGEPDTRGLP